MGGGRGWVVDGWTKTKLMLFSTQVEVVVEVGVELGKRLTLQKLSVGRLHQPFYTDLILCVIKSHTYFNF